MMLPIDVAARSYYRAMQTQVPRRDPDALPADVPPPESLKRADPAEAALAIDENPAARAVVKGDLRTFVENAKKSAATDNPPPNAFVRPTLRI